MTERESAHPSPHFAEFAPHDDSAEGFVADVDETIVDLVRS